MRQWVSVGAVVVASTVSLSGQLPLPDALMRAETVYIEPNGSVDRKTLGDAGKEFNERRRFRLIGNREEADLVVVFAKSTERSAPYLLPVPGFGYIGGQNDQDVYYVGIVANATGETVWSDQRDKHFTDGGAVRHLVKVLHEAIRDAPGR